MFPRVVNDEPLDVDEAKNWRKIMQTEHLEEKCLFFILYGFENICKTVLAPLQHGYKKFIWKFLENG